jgi:hypothetical protein
MAKFDPKKPYGEVFGVASHRYEQDGKRFDASGNEVTEKNVQPPKTQAATTKATTTENKASESTRRSTSS